MRYQNSFKGIITQKRESVMLRISGLLLLLLLFFFSPLTVYAQYESNSALAVEWLTAQQNDDGSWGSEGVTRFIQTVEAVDALRAAEINWTPTQNSPPKTPHPKLSGLTQIPNTRYTFGE